MKIREYTLDDKLLARLAQVGIRRESRTDGIFTLVDENPVEPQDIIPGFRATRHWNWSIGDRGKTRFDLRVNVRCYLFLNRDTNGVVIRPAAGGGVSPGRESSQFRMFKVLTDSDPHAPPICKELAATTGTLTVDWAELGFPGIVPISQLFGEFRKGNDAVFRLAKNGGIFDPPPFERHESPYERRFLIVDVQPRVLVAWTQQLTGYRDSLIISRANL